MIFPVNKTIRLIACFVFVASFSGCVSTSYMQNYKQSPKYIDLSVFAKENNFNLAYSAFSDKTILYSKNQKAVFRSGFSYFLLDGEAYPLGGKVSYNNGSILIPYSVVTYFKRKYREEKETKKDISSFIGIKIKRVIIDPGHGGRDPGAISPWGLKEKTVNLSIAKYLYGFLRKEGFEVYLTRSGDRFISLKGRVKFCRRKRGDLFISIHANSCPSKKIRGLSVYYLADKFTKRQARTLATAENLCRDRGLNPAIGIKRIIGDLVNRENKKETYEIAKAILSGARHFGIYTRGKIGAPFYVLKYNTSPAVLIEVGYLTNRKEERLLRSPIYRKQIASSISKAVAGLRDYYLGKRESFYE